PPSLTAINFDLMTTAGLFVIGHQLPKDTDQFIETVSRLFHEQRIDLKLLFETLVRVRNHFQQRRLFDKFLQVNLTGHLLFLGPIVNLFDGMGINIPNNKIHVKTSFVKFILEYGSSPILGGGREEHKGNLLSLSVLDQAEPGFEVISRKTA